MMGEEKYSISSSKSSLKLIRLLRNQPYSEWEADYRCIFCEIWRALCGVFLQSKWGQCSVTLMDISPALTGLPQTHKPVTAASVNHYPATLYLVHICRFTGLWNVFSVELGPNQIEMWSASWELRVTTSSHLTSDNQLVQMQNEKLHSNTAAWLIQGFQASARI